mmetsp:Transcript_19629/g.40341  ORF Transcript_19629/g.40341 Transcript_19629/m.40341 type:complete len:220 (-) Transcript_19629:423-1082(-)
MPDGDPLLEQFSQDRAAGDLCWRENRSDDVAAAHRKPTQTAAALHRHHDGRRDYQCQCARACDSYGANHWQCGGPHDQTTARAVHRERSGRDAANGNPGVPRCGDGRSGPCGHEPWRREPHHKHPGKWEVCVCRVSERRRGQQRFEHGRDPFPNHGAPLETPGEVHRQPHAVSYVARVHGDAGRGGKQWKQRAGRGQRSARGGGGGLGGQLAGGVHRLA